MRNIVIACTLVCGAVQADVIFDSMPGDSFAGPGVTLDDNLITQLAGSFTVTGEHTFDSVEISLHGLGNFASDTAHVEVRADAGGLPGAELADLGIRALPFFNEGFDILTFTDSGIPLADGGTYWIVVDPFFSTGGTWATSTGGDTGGNQQFINDFFGGGGDWEPLGDQLAFRVNATPAGGGPDPGPDPEPLGDQPVGLFSTGFQDVACSTASGRALACRIPFRM